MLPNRPLGLALSLLLLAACGGSPTTVDSGPDGGGRDAAADAARDAGTDLGAVDAGPCFADLDCDDGNDCTVDRCMFAAGACRHAARDVDGDGHGDSACGGDDCDDTDANRYPSNHEVCDATHDEDCDPATLGGDVDGDTFVSTACCNPQPTGSLLCGTDCNDLSATINPSAAESCNMVDDNCNGSTDEGVGATCYVDADGDGYAPAGAVTMMSTCTCGSGYTARDPSGSMSADCDDTVATISPASAEVCNFRDDNCNCTGAPDTTCVDEGLARPVSTTTSHFNVCVGAASCLTLLGSAMPNAFPGGFEVDLTLESTASDYGAAWEPSPLRMGWGPMDVTVRARGVGNASYPPGIAFAVALVRHVDGSSLAGVAADAGYPIDHNGILIEWVFNGGSPDELVAIKREAPPVTSSPVGFEMARVALPAPNFDAGADRPEHTFTIRYQTFRATGGELLEVYDGPTAAGAPLIHLTPSSPGVTVGYEFDVYDAIDVGVMSASDGATRSRVYFGADYSGTSSPFASTITRNGVCDTALP